MPFSAPKKRTIVFLGASGVGKTSLVNWITKNYSDPDHLYVPTVQEKHLKKFQYRGADVECNIVDTGGRDENDLVQPDLIVTTHCFVLAYAIDSMKSFDTVQHIHEKISTYMDEDSFPCVVVATKSDLGNGRRLVSEADGKILAERLKAAFIETSTWEKINVDKVLVLCMEQERKFSAQDKPGWWNYLRSMWPWKFDGGVIGTPLPNRVSQSRVDNDGREDGDADDGGGRRDGDGEMGAEEGEEDETGTVEDTRTTHEELHRS